MVACADIAVPLADDRYHAHPTRAETLCHLNRHGVAAARMRRQRRVFVRQGEIAEDPIRQAEQFSRKHGLPLSLAPTTGL